MLNAVIFGAGNIGRGFIAELLYKDGYKINFIDVNHSLINEINARKCYYVEHVYGDKSEIIQIDNINIPDIDTYVINYIIMKTLEIIIESDELHIKNLYLNVVE